MNIIITGGDFTTNKGGQAMLYITAYEILNRYPNCSIYFTCDEKYSKKTMSAIKINYLYLQSFRIAMKEASTKTYHLFTDIFFMLKLIKRRNLVKGALLSFAKKVIKNTTYIIDVSGFTLSSSLPNNNQSCELFLDMIAEANTLNIPVALMPQSFGPFDFNVEIRTNMLEKIRSTLKLPSLIFARENGGYELLVNHVGLTNVLKSNDLVLQNRDYDLSVVTYMDKIDMTVPRVLTDNNVLVIPSLRVLEKAHNESEFYGCYQEILDYLLKQKVNIYLSYHSPEDKAVARKIKEFYKRDDRVIFVDKELNFWQYEKYVQSFKYIITSRFHSIVNAYKHYVPCICLGWAEKYENLFASCKQKQYVVDISCPNYEEKLLVALRNMNIYYSREKDLIRESVEIIQKNNCFDVLFKKMDLIIKDE